MLKLILMFTVWAVAFPCIGAKKVEAMEKYTEPVEMKMMKEIKRALDPKNILNPGKVFNA